MSDSLGAGFYFATPYHSWERGLNEHTHGLVRQYFPKGTGFRMVTEAQVRAVEDRLNHRPGHLVTHGRGSTRPEGAGRPLRR